MRHLAALLAALLLAAPASARDLASESTYAANNPVKHTDRNGMLPDDSPGWDRLAAAQLGMSGGEKAAQGRMAVSMMPAAGDFIAAAISIGEAILSPSMANTETAGWGSLGAALPFVPAVGTLKRVGEAGDALPAINPQKQAGHIEGSPQYKNRVDQGKPTSKWNEPAEADGLTREAHAKGEKPPGDRKETMYQPTTESGAPRPVGTGPNGGTQMKVKVSEGKDGKIHGTPWGEEHNFGP